MEEQLQHQRFERKYFITERQAFQIREFIKGYLVPDRFSENRPNYAYPVHSLYLDSDDLKTYWWTINGDRNRFKLRLRFYDSNPKSPVYCEITAIMGNSRFGYRSSLSRTRENRPNPAAIR